MAEDTNTRTEILDIQVNYGDALDGIARYNREIEVLQANQVKLKEEVKTGAITQTEYQKALAATRIQLKQAGESARALEKEIANNIKTEKEQEGSINQLRAKVSNLTKEYDNMSAAMRKSADGEAFLKNLNNIKDELNDAVEASQRFQHNVGNYQSAFMSAAAGGNAFASSLLSMATAGRGASGIITGLTGQVKALFTVIMSNPIIAILAVIVGAIMAIKNAIDSSEEATAKWNRVLAPLNLLLDTLLNVLQKVVGWLLDGVEAIQGFVLGLSRMAESLPIVGEYIKQVNDEVERSIQLEREKTELEKQTRAFTEESAKRRRDIAKLQQQSEDRLTYSAEERLAFTKQANALLQKNAEDEYRLKLRSIELAEVEASRTENTTDKERELAKLRAERYDAETAYLGRLKELTARESTLTQEGINAQKTAADAAKKAREDAAKAREDMQKRELDAIKKYEDTVTGLITSERDRRIKTIGLQYDREIAELEKSLTEKKGLTEAAEKAITDTIILKRQEREQEIAKATQELSDAEFKKQSDIILKNLQNQQALIKANSEEALQLRKQILEQQREVELREAEKLGLDRTIIAAKYAKLIADEDLKAQKDINKRLLDEQKAYYNNRLLEAKLRGESEIQLRLEEKQKELNSIAQLEDESDQMFILRKQQIDLQLQELQQQRANEILEMYSANVTAAGAMFGAFSELLENFAETNQVLAAFSKALALFEIAMATGEAIAKGVAAAQSVPFPGNLAAIAVTIAAVVSNIARATKIINGTKTPQVEVVSAGPTNIQRFSEGGLVQGPGSGTSDSIPARLSAGESVNTARATAMFSPLLSAFNQIGGGIPIATQQAAQQVEGEAFLVDAFTKALSKLPPNKLVISELDDVQNRVDILEDDTRI